MLAFSLLLPLAGLVAPGEGAAQGPRSTSLLFRGGTFHVGFDVLHADRDHGRTAQAVLVRDGRIAAIGDEATLAASEEGRGAERVDIRGGHAFPGFQDAHVDLEALGEALEQLDLGSAAGFDEAVARVRERAAELPPGSWVRGRGWDDRLLPAERAEVIARLTAAAPDHPVLLEDVDGGAALVNERAFATAEIDASEPPDDPEGGRIERDAEGAATGVLERAAADLVRGVAPAPSDADRRRRILRAQETLIAAGVTCAHEMGVDLRGLEIRQELRSEGRLALRLVAYLDDATVEGVSDLAKLRLDDPRDRLTVVGIHLTVDGWLSSRGAALAEPYADAPEAHGDLDYDAGALDRRLRAIAEAGLQPSLHVAGDRASALVVGSLGRVRASLDYLPRLRPRLEGCRLMAPFDLARLDELGVVASVQPTRALRERPIAALRLGEARFARVDAWGQIRASTGLPLALGSGAPAGAVGPLEGVVAALTGAPPGSGDPAEKIDAEVALAGWTIAPSFAAFQEDRRGLTARGYFCDLTVVDVDLSQLTPTTAAEALDAKVLMTVVNGEVVYNAP
ncbi:MAG: amidohydrolase [Planctomycetota bacterium]